MDSVKGLQLTRVGNFEFRDGYLVDGQGNVVYGFLTSALTDPAAGGAAGNTVGNTSTALVPIRLPMKSTRSRHAGRCRVCGRGARHRQERGPPRMWTASSTMKT